MLRQAGKNVNSPARTPSQDWLPHAATVFHGLSRVERLSQQGRKTGTRVPGVGRRKRLPHSVTRNRRASFMGFRGRHAHHN